MKCRLAAGDPLDSRIARPPVLSLDDHAKRVQRMGHVGQKCSTQCWKERFCSMGASLRRADPELVKLNAPVLLPSPPRLARMEAEGAIH